MHETRVPKLAEYFLAASSGPRLGAFLKRRRFACILTSNPGGEKQGAKGRRTRGLLYVGCRYSLENGDGLPNSVEEFGLTESFQMLKPILQSYGNLGLERLM